MNTQPLVSIVIPTYNQAAYLAQTIASALAQDYEPLEIIVSDDCSPDDTAGVVSAFSDSRLRYIRNPRNLGRVGNYRRALYEYAAGAWALNLDGDDLLIDRTFISSAVKAALREQGTVLVFGDRYELDDPIISVPVLDAAGRTMPEYLDGTEYVLSLPDNKIRIHHLTALYDRAAAMEIDFYRADILSSDYESLWRLAIGKTIAHLPSPVAVWRRHRKNASRTGDMNTTVRNFSLFTAVHDYAIDLLGEEVRATFDAWLVRSIANRYYGSACNQLRSGDFASLSQLRAFIKTTFPLSYRKAMLQPKLYLKGAIELIRYGLRAFPRILR